MVVVDLWAAASEILLIEICWGVGETEVDALNSRGRGDKRDNGAEPSS